MTTTAATIGRTYRARICADQAARRADHAADLLAAGFLLAATLPADFRTPGGADAATVVRFMADDKVAAVNSATLAAHAAATVDPDAALTHAENAREAVETMRRYLTHLTR